MHAISTILPVSSPISQRLLPRQRLSSYLDRPDVPTSITSLLPRLDVPVVDKVAMEPQLELERQVDHGQRALGEILSIEHRDVIPQLIQSIHQRNQVPLALLGIFTARDEAWLLHGRRRAEEIRILFAIGQRVVQVPRVVTQAVEQPSRRWTTFLKVVRLRRVDSRLPKVLVLLGHPAVVDAAELAVDVPHVRGLDARLGLGFRVEDPACCLAVELVAGCYFVWLNGREFLCTFDVC